MICKPYQCLFVHVPKTAGQSIVQFFTDRLGDELEQGGDAVHLQRNDDPARGPEKLSHLSAAEYVSGGHLTQQEFDSLYKFTIVRNPWSRLLSEYMYRNYFHHRSFRYFVLNRLPEPGMDDQYRHVMPQYDMLHDAGGRLLVDFVGRFESLQDDFTQICDRLGIEDSMLPHRNRSDKKSRNRKRTIRNLLYFNGENSYRTLGDFYDAETREAVARYYSRDIEAFGYEFPG